jgi:hypothetical protein
MLDREVADGSQARNMKIAKNICDTFYIHLKTIHIKFYENIWYSDRKEKQKS